MKEVCILYFQYDRFTKLVNKNFFTILLPCNSSFHFRTTVGISQPPWNISNDIICYSPWIMWTKIQLSIMWNSKTETTAPTASLIRCYLTTLRLKNIWKLLNWELTKKRFPEKWWISLDFFSVIMYQFFLNFDCSFLIHIMKKYVLSQSNCSKWELWHIIVISDHFSRETIKPTISKGWYLTTLWFKTLWKWLNYEITT